MKNRLAHWLIVILCLGCGVFIYFFSRPQTIYLNQWLATITHGHRFFDFDSWLSGVRLPGWFIYSLPDALWMAAAILLILMIWDFKLYTRSIFWLGLAFLSGLLFELLQAIHLLPGTFDVMDILFLTGGAVFPLIITPVKFRT